MDPKRPDINLLNEISDDPFDEEGDYGRGFAAGRQDAAQKTYEALKACEDEAAETYVRRKAQGIDDQAKEWAIRARTWKSARRIADEATR